VVLDLNIDGSSGLRLIEPLLQANPTAASWC
jgi:ActR/RegA family two-component response regulator